MTHASLFSGIGGFDLAAEQVGWENKFHCEINEFCSKILKYYWPDAESYKDIKETNFSKWKGTIDVLSGGFPCQPYSVAGKRKGKEDDRHLWPEMLRAIYEISPRWVVGENVRGLVNWNGGVVFDEVQADLEAAGYEVLPFLLPACAVNAPHRRDRIWFIAYSQRNGDVFDGGGGRSLHHKNRDNPEKEPERNYFPDGLSGFGERPIADGSNARLEGVRQERENAVYGFETAANSNSHQRYEGRLHPSEPETAERHAGALNARRNGPPGWLNFPTQPPVRSGDDGFPTELLRQRIRADSMGCLSEKEINQIISKAAPEWRNESIKAMGNAIVPQVAIQIFKSIQKQYKS